MHRQLAGGGARGRALAWAGFGALGLFSLLLSLTLLRELLVGLALLAGWDARPLSAMAVPLLALGLGTWGLWQAQRTPAVRRVRVNLPDLPPALEGLKIVQLSDLHVGPTLRRGFVQALVARVNTLEADLVALTGDLVDGTVPELAAQVAPLAGLRSRWGSFVVTGNHEYYAGCRPWLQEFEGLGLKVLMNAHVLLQPGPQQADALLLAGVSDWSAHAFEPSHRSSPQQALRGAPARVGARVLLAHQPRSAPAAAQAGFDLQLSGHTHGGQVWPWSYLVYLQQPFRAGLRRQGRMWIYISRGSGYWGPPLRLGAPSEITLIELHRA
jgi:predicted MPP superfamily phosphohydrolase